MLKAKSLIFTLKFLHLNSFGQAWTHLDSLLYESNAA